MIEREMDYRGSKSIIEGNIFVKEQRVDGSWRGIYNPLLRCTLMGFERNCSKRLFMNYSFSQKQSFGTVFEVKQTLPRKHSNQNPFLANIKLINFVLYKQELLHIRNISNTSLKDRHTLGMSGWWLTGFVDAEGCFRLSILKNPSYKEGVNEVLPFKPRLYFQIGLHRKDELILKSIQFLLGVGKIYKSRPDLYELQVSSIKDISAIINHFDNYPLITQKFADYKLFKQAFNIIINKEHLTKEGLAKLISIKASMNLGITPLLKKAYPNIIPIARDVVNQEIPDPDWLAGFTTGEGCFLIRIFNSSSSRLGLRVQLRFQITQHCRDKILMDNIVKYLDCGYISIRNDIVDFYVTNYTDIAEKIIPFFAKYSILGVKMENYNDFKLAATLFQNKEHLTEEGLEKIKVIKSNMNSYRVSNANDDN